MTETLISSSVLISVVILLRTVFKGRINNRARYALWLIVAARLLMPFDLAESSVSVMNLFGSLELPRTSEMPEISRIIGTLTEPVNAPDTAELLPARAVSGGNTGSVNENSMNIQRESAADEKPYNEKAVCSLPQALPYDEISEAAEISEISAAPEVSAASEVSATPEVLAISEIPEAPAMPSGENGRKLSAAEIFGLVRVIGTAVMLAWFIIVNITFHRRLKRDRTPLGHSCPLKTYICKGLASPCVFGFVRPSVYVTPEAAREKRVLDFVVAHELCHYYHGDIFWTALRYVLLSVYWFDPFVWAAAVLSKRDCECACDEAVICRFGGERRFEYGKAIVDMIPEKGSEMFGVASTSMSSGGRVLRERINFISKNPKNLTAAVICTVLVMFLAAGSTFTSAASPEPGTYEEAFPDEAAVSAEENVSYLKGRDDLYINVTDRSGSEKTLFYMLPPTSEEEAFVYMDNVSDEPYARIGYIPEISLDVPAKNASGYYGQQMTEFIEASRFSAVDITCKSGSGNIVRRIKSSRSGEAFESVKDAVAELSSAVQTTAVQNTSLTENTSENICAQVEFYRENGGFSSKLAVTFRNKDGRIEGKIVLEDYSGIISLITAKEQPPSENALERAYASSCRMESEWFEAGDSELYRLCISETGGDSRSSLLPVSYDSPNADTIAESAAAKKKISGKTSTPLNPGKNHAYYEDDDFSVTVCLTDLCSSLYYPEIVHEAGADPGLFAVTVSVRAKNISEENKTLDVTKFSLPGTLYFDGEAEKFKDIKPGRTVIGKLRFLCTLEQAAEINGIFYGNEYLETGEDFFPEEFEDIIDIQSADDIREYLYRTYEEHYQQGYFFYDFSPITYEMHSVRGIKDGAESYISVTCTACNRSDYAQLIDPSAFQITCVRYNNEEPHFLEPLYIVVDESLVYSPRKAELDLEGVGQLYEVPEFISMNRQNPTEFTLIYPAENCSRVRMFNFIPTHNDDPCYSEFNPVLYLFDWDIWREHKYGL